MKGPLARGSWGLDAVAAAAAAGGKTRQEECGARSS